MSMPFKEHTFPILFKYSNILMLGHRSSRRKIVQGFGGKAQRKEATQNTRYIDGRMGSKWILRGVAGRVWSGFTWLRMGTSGRILSTQ
jgi:hypothetical protein